MTSSKETDARGNQLLRVLPASNAQRIAEKLVRVSLSHRSILVASGQPLDSVYFPLTAMVALVNSDADHRTAAVALSGHRDLVGIGVVLGSPVSIHNAVVLMEGDALMMPRSEFQDEMTHDPIFRYFMLRYAHSLMTQISFTSVCERIHSVEQRLIRWLLLGDDRGVAARLELTQDALATLMGARRESVSLAAGKLQASELIQYKRGKIMIVDREGLERRACQCYCEIRAEYARLFARAV